MREAIDLSREPATDVNLRGNWLFSQVVCRRLIAEKRTGSIVNIGSIQAAKVLPGRTHYAPTKLGLEALTRNMSAEMTPLGIRVNCVHPGLIDTDMTEWVMKSPDILPVVLAQISLGRAGQPREVGHVVAFFASDDASYLTGQSVFRRRPMPEPEPAGVESQGSPLFREVVSGNVEGGEAMPAGGLS